MYEKRRSTNFKGKWLAVEHYWFKTWVVRNPTRHNAIFTSPSAGRIHDGKEIAVREDGNGSWRWWRHECHRSNKQRCTSMPTVLAWALTLDDLTNSLDNSELRTKRKTHTNVSEKTIAYTKYTMRHNISWTKSRKTKCNKKMRLPQWIINTKPSESERAGTNLSEKKNDQKKSQKKTKQNKKKPQKEERAKRTARRPAPKAKSNKKL